MLLSAVEILDVSCVLQIGAWLLGLGLLSASAVVVTWGNATTAVASAVASALASAFSSAVARSETVIRSSSKMCLDCHGIAV